MSLGVVNFALLAHRQETADRAELAIAANRAMLSISQVDAPISLSLASLLSLSVGLVSNATSYDHIYKLPPCL